MSYLFSQTEDNFRSILAARFQNKSLLDREVTPSDLDFVDILGLDRYNNIKRKSNYTQHYIRCFLEYTPTETERAIILTGRRIRDAKRNKRWFGARADRTTA